MCCNECDNTLKSWEREYGCSEGGGLLGVVGLEEVEVGVEGCTGFRTRTRRCSSECIGGGGWRATEQADYGDEHCCGLGGRSRRGTRVDR